MEREQVIRSGFTVSAEEAKLFQQAADLVVDADVRVRSHEETLGDTVPAPRGQAKVGLVNRTPEGYQEFKSRLAELRTDAVV